MEVVPILDLHSAYFLLLVGEVEAQKLNNT